MKEEYLNFEPGTLNPYMGVAMAEEKSSRFIFVKCAACAKFFQVERSYWEPKYDAVPLRCPHCHTEFRKEEAPKLIGL